MLHNANLRASAFMTLAMAGFTINDALVKSIGADLSMGQIMVVRGVIVVACMLVYVRVMGLAVQPRGALSGPVVIRTAAEVGATITFLTALAHIPLANLSALLQALPLLVTLGAAMFFGEQVGWRRLTAIAVGFAGVMLIVRPGMAGFNIFALLGIAAVLCAAVRDLATRRIQADISSMTVSLTAAITVTITGLAVVPFAGGWQAMSAGHVLTLTAAAGFLFVGYHCIVLAMRDGDIGFVAPFRYTSLLWAIVLGLVFFGEIPDALTIIGAVIIVGTGLYALYRERVVAQATAATDSAASSPPARGT